jgi:hypothetical protein
MVRSQISIQANIDMCSLFNTRILTHVIYYLRKWSWSAGHSLSIGLCLVLDPRLGLGLSVRVQMSPSYFHISANSGSRWDWFRSHGPILIEVELGQNFKTDLRTDPNIF